MRKRTAVDVFQFASHRYTVSNTRGLDTLRTRHIADVLGGGFTFGRGIGCKDHFLELTTGKTFIEPVEPEQEEKLTLAEAARRRGCERDEHRG